MVINHPALGVGTRIVVVGGVVGVGMGERCGVGTTLALSVSTLTCKVRKVAAEKVLILSRLPRDQH